MRQCDVVAMVPSFIFLMHEPEYNLHEPEYNLHEPINKTTFLSYLNSLGKDQARGMKI